MWFEILIGLGVKLYGLAFGLFEDGFSAVSFLQAKIKIRIKIIHWENGFRKRDVFFILPEFNKWLSSDQFSQILYH